MCDTTPLPSSSASNTRLPHNQHLLNRPNNTLQLPLTTRQVKLSPDASLITAMQSVEGEVVELAQPLAVGGGVEGWLVALTEVGVRGGDSCTPQAHCCIYCSLYKSKESVSRVSVCFC